MVGEPIRVGIVGLGRSGWGIHARTLAEAEGFRVVAVADAEAERRQEAVERFACRAYAQPAELLDDPRVELVVVATPSHTHAAVGEAALRAGKHVLVEKPMATSLAEADRLLAAARETGRVLTVFQQRRFDPDFLKVQEVVASGKLGPLHLVKMSRHSYQRRRDWQTLRKFGGGQLNNWGAHVIDQALVLLQGEAELVFADLKHTVSAGDADDHVKVVLRGRSGLVVDIEVSTCAAYPQPVWVVFGQYGGLTGSTQELRWRYYDPAALPPLVAEEGPAPGRSYGTGEQIPWVEESASLRGQGGQEALFYQALRRTLREGAPLLVTPESVRQQIAIMEECRRRTGF